jgi:glutamyl-tRNA(Gln) amidotransferase subunit D
MSYSERARQLLASSQAREGDTVRLKVRGKEHEGILMPHHEFSHPDVIVIKLKSGYNMGLKVDEGSELTLGSRAQERTKKAKDVVNGKDLPMVSFLGTGGTIASYVDYRTGAVHPALKAEELVATVPELSEICRMRSHVVFSIFSENMTPQNWQTLASAVADELNDGAEGVIVPHGTDTLGFTSAALSFMLGDVPRSVLLVGAQRSSDRPSSDSYINLLSSARFCVNANAAEVFTLMHGESSDSYVHIHRGTKVRKMHTSRRDAFQSVNCAPVARLGLQGELEMLSECRPKSKTKVVPDTRMEKDVALLYFYPGMSTEIVRKVMEGHKGLVMAGTGLGHVSRDMVQVLKDIISEGRPVVMTSQCLGGRVNLNVYDTGRDLLSAGVIPGEDMLPETALIKLMWVLGRTQDMPEVEGEMLTDRRGEISRRRDL